MIFQTSMIMFHVNLPGCKQAVLHHLWIWMQKNTWATCWHEFSEILIGSASRIRILISWCRKSNSLSGYMDVSENSGFSPQIIHFNRVFHYFHHPFWGPTPIFGNTHIVVHPLNRQLQEQRNPLVVPNIEIAGISPIFQIGNTSSTHSGSILPASYVSWSQSVGRVQMCQLLSWGTPHPFGVGSKNRRQTAKTTTIFEWSKLLGCPSRN